MQPSVLGGWCRHPKDRRVHGKSSHYFCGLRNRHGINHATVASAMLERANAATDQLPRMCHYYKSTRVNGFGTPCPCDSSNRRSQSRYRAWLLSRRGYGPFWISRMCLTKGPFLPRTPNDQAIMDGASRLLLQMMQWDPALMTVDQSSFADVP